MTLAESLTAAGLVLDIVGAGVIAAPDIPRLNRFSRYGRLRIGREKLESGGVVRGEMGFEEIEAILEDLDPIEDFNDEGGEFEEVLLHQRGGFTSDKITQSDITWGNEYVEVRYEESDDLDDTAFYDVSEVFRELRKGIQPSVTKVRAGGFLTLASGFFLQLVAALL
jgi:hypothetical protein